MTIENIFMWWFPLLGLLFFGAFYILNNKGNQKESKTFLWLAILFVLTAILASVIAGGNAR